MKPRLLDLFCGAGGAGMGYHRAGFDVGGVDLAPMPNYPFEFHQGDALEYVAEHGHEFDAIHASPPCQGYLNLGSVNCALGRSYDYPDLIGPTRAALVSSGLPYVIENVIGAPLRNPIMLCGSMFGLRVWRHRLFEFGHMPTPFVLLPPCAHLGLPVTVYGDSTPSYMVAKLGRHYTNAEKAAGLDVNWPMTGNELSQAIPPAYTEFVGTQLIRALEVAA